MDSKVTICLATYNGSSRIMNTVNAILCQSYSNWELIIVNDGSDDCTDKLVQQTILPLDNRIRYFSHERNIGLANARNTALLHSNGLYFTFCDDDDIWRPNTLETLMQGFVSSSCDAVFASRICSNATVNSIKSTIYKLVVTGFTPPVGSQIYRADLLKKIGGYNPVVTGVDHDLWIGLGAHNEVVEVNWLNICLVTVNNVEDSRRMTWNYEKRKQGIIKTIELWRHKYSREYSSDFFNALNLNYSYYINKRFLLSSNYSLTSRMQCLLGLPKSLLVNDLKVKTARRLYGENLLLPLFFMGSSTTKITFDDKGRRSISNS